MNRDRAWVVGLVFVIGLWPSPAVFADDVEGLRALVEQQRKDIAELAKRVADLEHGLAKPATEPSARETIVAEPSGNILAHPPASPAPTPAQGATPGDLLGDMVHRGAFPRSFMIPGSNISLRIAGYVRFDGIYDDGAVGSGVRYFPDTIGVKGTPQAADSGVTRLSAGQTRLNFEAQAPRSVGNLRTFVEADFFGAGDTFHLRHAYGEAGGVLGGYTWTALMDLRALPQTVAFTAPVGAIYRPQGVLRYRHRLAKGTAFTLSAENPAADVATGAGERALRPIPDLLANINYSPAPSRHLQLAGIYRRSGLENASGQKLYANGWGMTLTGHLATFGKDEIRAGGAWGDGIGSYVAGFATSPTSAAISPSGQLEALEAKAGYVSYLHWWNPHLRTTALYGIARLDNLDSQPATALHLTESAGANLVWSPVAGFGVGLEYLWGRRQNKNGAEGTDPRVQLGIQFGY